MPWHHLPYGRYGTFSYVFPTQRNVVYAQSTNALNPVSNVIFAFRIGQLAKVHSIAWHGIA